MRHHIKKLFSWVLWQWFMDSFLWVITFIGRISYWLHYYSSYFLNTVKIPYHEFFFIYIYYYYSQTVKEQPQQYIRKWRSIVCYFMMSFILKCCFATWARLTFCLLSHAVCICQWPYLCLPVWISRENKIEIREHWLSGFKTDRQQQSWLLIKVRLGGLGSVTVKGGWEGWSKRNCSLGIRKNSNTPFQTTKNILNERMKFKWCRNTSDAVDRFTLE